MALCLRIKCPSTLNNKNFISYQNITIIINYTSVHAPPPPKKKRRKQTNTNHKKIKTLIITTKAKQLNHSHITIKPINESRNCFKYKRKGDFLVWI